MTKSTKSGGSEPKIFHCLVHRACWDMPQLPTSPLKYNKAWEMNSSLLCVSFFVFFFVFLLLMNNSAALLLHLSVSFSPPPDSLSLFPPSFPPCLVLFSIIISSPPARLQTLWSENLHSEDGERLRKTRGERESWTEREGRRLKEAIVPS